VEYKSFGISEMLAIFANSDHKGILIWKFNSTIWHIPILS